LADEPIRVLIVDDHAVVREGLRTFLELQPGLEVVGEAGDGEEALPLAERLEPDVVLMDLSMPGLDGIEATKRVLAARPGTQVLVLTSFSDRDSILKALDAGACGYLLKDAEPDELLRAIRAAARGEAPLSPRAAQALLSARREPSPVAALSEREQEVLSLVAAGMANKQIARRLGISEKTVKAHLTRVFREIGVFDRTQAALWAQRNGLV
jgi:DNA-binding NarL/FixJ family response regulator